MNVEIEGLLIDIDGVLDALRIPDAHRGRTPFVGTENRAGALSSGVE